jgi:hypothetical protein
VECLDRDDFGLKSGVLVSMVPREAFPHNPDHRITFPFTPTCASWLSESYQTPRVGINPGRRGRALGLADVTADNVITVGRAMQKQLGS